MNKGLRTLTNGIIRENPILVLVLGTCPFMAVTTQASNAIGMGASRKSLSPPINSRQTENVL